jgi:iron complex outermembrane recepter protein
VFANDSANGVPFGQPTNTVSTNTSHEIRLQSEERIGGMFDYVVGALFAKGGSDTIFGSVTGIALAPPFVSAPTLLAVVLTPINRFGTNKETSFFGNVTAHITEDLEVSGGVRHIKYEDDSGLAINNVVNPLFSRDFVEKKVVYQASIKYDVTPDVMVYASTGTSWRPSTIAIGGPTGGVSARQLSFLGTDPETSTSYEIGLKSALFDRRVTFNLTGFYQKFQNYPYRSSSGIFAIDRTNSAAGTVNAFNYVAGVPVDVKGFEAEIGFRPNDNLSLSTILSYSKGRIKNGNVPCLDLNDDGVPDVVTSPPSLAALEADVGADNIDQCTVNFNSNLSPSWSGTVIGEYSRPLNDRMDGYLRGLFTWKGNSVNDPVNAFDDVPGYGILNLYAGLRASNGAWEMSLYGKNITNTFRVLTRSNGPSVTSLRAGIPLGPPPVVSSGPIAGSYYGITVTEPREFGINLRFAFGSR